MLFLQLTNADCVANNAAMIDNFPQRMERFLDCISQVYFEHESFDSVVTGGDKTVGKKLMRSFQTEMASTKMPQQHSSPGFPAKDMPGVDN